MGAAYSAICSCSSPPPALTSRRPGAQASLPTKAAPPVKRRFESSLARRLLPLTAARAYAPSALSGPGASLPAVTSRPPDSRGRARGFAGAARALRRRPRSRLAGSAQLVAACAPAASKVAVARKGRGSKLCWAVELLGRRRSRAADGGHARRSRRVCRTPIRVRTRLFRVGRSAVINRPLRSGRRRPVAASGFHDIGLRLFGPRAVP